MADKKITELTPTTGANLSDADEFVVVDVSADETKSVTRAEFFKNTPSIISSGTISSSKTSGYGGVEVGGPSGGLIDLKAPASDDYDARIIYNAGTDLQIITLADEPILLRQGNTTRLKTTTTGTDVTGTITSDGLIVATTGEVIGTIGSTSTAGARQATLRLNVASTGGDDPAGKVQFTYGAGYSVAGSIEMTHTNPNMKFLTGTTERMRIDSNGNVGLGTSSPSTSAILDVQSTTKGLRFPNMTTTQKNAMADVAGVQVFDTTLGKMCFNTGSAWETMTSS